MTVTAGGYLRLLRQRRGISQEGLANEFGTDQNQISRWERGKDQIRLPVAIRLGVCLIDTGHVLQRLAAGEEIRVCTHCGCHELSACMEHDGRACAWVDDDTCTACAQAEVAAA